MAGPKRCKSGNQWTKCPGIIGISDDVVVFGKDVKVHDRNLLYLMEAAKENEQKSNIKTKSINFFRSIFNEKGLHLDHPKVEDIKTPESPANEAEFSIS